MNYIWVKVVFISGFVLAGLSRAIFGKRRKTSNPAKEGLPILVLLLLWGLSQVLVIVHFTTNWLVLPTGNSHCPFRLQVSSYSP